MSLFKLSASLSAVAAVVGVNALPAASSSYEVKERHVVPRSWTNVGSADKAETMHMQIGLKQRNEGVIERHLIEVSDPYHVRYGDHLTADEIHDLVSPADETRELVHSWLQEHGISNIGYSPGKDWIHIVVPVEKAEELLQTKYSTFQNSAGDTISRTPEWSLPKHLHEHIDVIQPTTSFFRPEAQAVEPVKDKDVKGGLTWWEHTGKAAAAQSYPSTAAAVGSICNASFVTLDCLRVLYETIDYKVKAAGENKVAICNYLNESNRIEDIHAYLETYRPAAANAEPHFVNIANAENYQGNNYTYIEDLDLEVEGNLDAELVLGISWPTPLISYLTGGSPPFLPDDNTPTDTNEPYLTWLNYVLSQKNLPQTISSSYGDDEQTVPESYAKRVCSSFAQLGARGVTMFVSSGDSGVGSDGTCYSNDGNNTYKFLAAFPTSCPWVTSVGATANFNPETAVTRFASGGGFSNYFPAPAYQKSTVNKYIASLNGTYDGLYNKAGRGYPDVAAQGNHDVIVYANETITVGGTSASSPTFAAIVALLNDALIAAGKKPLGFINPWIYSEGYKGLTDVTIGSSFGCNTTGFPAEVGWDAVTGFGTPLFKDLLKLVFEKNSY